VNPARVIGVGSPFGADRIGWEMVDELERSAAVCGLPPDRVRFSRCARPVGELLAALERPGLVLLIDAMRSGAVPGSVRCVHVNEVMRGGTLISTHGFGINSALSLASALGSLAAEVRICGIEIPPASTPGDSNPAPALATVRDEILSEIRRILMLSLREYGYL